MENEEKDNKTNEIEAPSIKERYEILIKARNFHYENYSKWMTYFYVAISALFVSFYTISSKTNAEIENQDLLQFSLLVIGFIVSLLWYWSSKGYYYWNINFISMVNFYESVIFDWKPEERVYKVFYDKSLQNNYMSPVSGANISTSKIAILFAYVITLFWGFLLFFKCYESLNCTCNSVFIILLSMLSSIFAILILSVIIPKYVLFSKNDEFPEIVNKTNVKI
ncbi:MAG: hypothetical protein HYU67_04775 [Flavobacteriia bacterium]|nr:hypothetical protein [Flavobacteriia bacterium]